MLRDAIRLRFRQRRLLRCLSAFTLPDAARFSPYTLIRIRRASLRQLRPFYLRSRCRFRRLP